MKTPNQLSFRMILFLRAIGLLFLLSPVFLYWLIHGDYNRYLWIINGPFPLSHLGSAPFQIVIYISLFFLGLIILLFSLKLNKS